ncbi:MAG: hypothetical protein HQK51_04915 [Oligoflexia bacterium]|nr:hypothetical protein [Oligoflexia bacterium]
MKNDYYFFKKNARISICFLPLLIMLLLLNSCIFQKEIPLIGINSSGNEIIQHIPSKGYTKETGKILSDLNRETILTLNSVKTEYSSWELKRFFVGIGINASLGINSIVTLDTLGTVFLYYEKN